MVDGRSMLRQRRGGTRLGSGQLWEGSSCLPVGMAGMCAICGQDFGFYPMGSGWNPRRAMSGAAAGADVGDRPADPALGLDGRLLPVNCSLPQHC